ncbi:guanylate kinase [SAR86 cluster bacterium]|nr:guanylate kinase [SAR86 cluster bacterium]
MNKNLHNLFVISSPSGGGKTSLLKAFFDDHRAKEIVMSVSHTTRKKRPGDMEGKDYFFIEKEDFLKKEKKNDFIETANVFGNLYGTDKKFVYDQLQISDVILELDWQGAESIKRIFPDAFLISLIPPSYKDLEDRLRGRALDTDNAISKRLSESKTEVTKCLSFDFLILNDEFKKALDDLKEIIFNKKKVNEFESRVSSKLTKNLLDLK